MPYQGADGAYHKKLKDEDAAKKVVCPIRFNHQVESKKKDVGNGRYYKVANKALF